MAATQLSEGTKKVFLNFYFGSQSASDFEKWLYNSAVEKELNGNDYLELISADYHISTDIYKVHELIEKIYSAQTKRNIFMDRAISVLEAMDAANISLKEGCKILTEIHFKGHEFIPVLFDGFSSEIDRLDNESYYADQIIIATRKLLTELKA